MVDSPSDEEIEDMYFNYVQSWIKDRLRNRLDKFLNPDQYETEIHNSTKDMKDREIKDNPKNWKLGMSEDYSIVSYANKWFFDLVADDVRGYINRTYDFQISEEKNKERQEELKQEKNSKLNEFETTLEIIGNRKTKEGIRKGYKTK